MTDFSKNPDQPSRSNQPDRHPGHNIEVDADPHEVEILCNFLIAMGQKTFAVPNLTNMRHNIKSAIEGTLTFWAYRNVVHGQSGDSLIQERAVLSYLSPRPVTAQQGKDMYRRLSVSVQMPDKQLQEIGIDPDNDLYVSDRLISRSGSEFQVTDLTELGFNWPMYDPSETTTPHNGTAMTTEQLSVFRQALGQE